MEKCEPRQWDVLVLARFQGYFENWNAEVLTDFFYFKNSIGLEIKW